MQSKSDSPQEIEKGQQPHCQTLSSPIDANQFSEELNPLNCKRAESVSPLVKALINSNSGSYRS